jgi:hypothetical protein
VCLCRGGGGGALDIPLSKIFLDGNTYLFGNLGLHTKLKLKKEF